jgi:hypothetical protein
VVLLVAALLVVTDTVRDARLDDAGSPGTAAKTTNPTAGPGASPAPSRPAASPSGAVAGVRGRTAALHGRVDLGSAEFVSWARLDRRTGQITGSTNLAAPSDTMSMIKAWLAADYLRMADERRETPSANRIGQLSIMIRDSDNGAAETTYRLLGGRPSIERLVAICGLSDSRPYHRPYWSNTVVSARDTARMGACLADGRAAGRRWTAWLLDEMRAVRGVGDFGVRAALPPEVAATVAIKNGWLLRDEDGLWHLSCLAIAPDWVIAVLARYPGRLGFRYGTRLCRQVGASLLPA